jgi:hypothetical protein
MTMRKILIVLIAACAACAPRGAGNEAGNAAAITASEPAATISVAAAQGGACAARWDGAAVTRDQILERGAAMLQAAIERIGGVQNLTEDNIPYLRLEAPADVAMACVAPALGAVQRVGFSKVALRLSGGRPTADVVAQLPLIGEGDARPSVVVALGANGGMTWNGEAIDLAGLSARAPAGPREGSFDEQAPPGAFVIALSPDATFGAAYEALRVAGHAGAGPTLSGCVSEGRPDPSLEALRC